MSENAIPCDIAKMEPHHAATYGAAIRAVADGMSANWQDHTASATPQKQPAEATVAHSVGASELAMMKKPGRWQKLLAKLKA